MDQTALFFSAVERGDVDAVGSLLAGDAGLAHARDSSGATALHYAAFNGHRALTELLLAAGASINARDDTYGATPAGWAIHHLRERGALLAIEIDDVLFAIRRGDAELVARLVTRHPALRDAIDREGTPLAAHASASQDVTIGSLFEVLHEDVDRE